jgi:iron complex transport system ATP-binding protein
MIISIKNFSFSYEKEVLKNINLDIEKGTFVSIIGPNGAGKSTLLKAICGLLHEYKGEILIDNINLKKYTRKTLAQKISYVAQENIGIFDYTVEEVISMGFYSKKKNLFHQPSTEKLEEVMEETETYNLRSKSIKELSGGEKQRVFIARALIQESPVMLLDEPIANLDMKHQGSLMKLCKKLSKEKGYTIISVLHDINLASIYSDYLAVMKDGNLMCYDRADKLINKELIKDVYEVEVEVIPHGRGALIIPT